MPLITVSESAKREIDRLQSAAASRLGRRVTQAEIVDGLLAEHDEHREEVTP